MPITRPTAPATCPGHPARAQQRASRPTGHSQAFGPRRRTHWQPDETNEEICPDLFNPLTQDGTTMVVTDALVARAI